MLTDYKVKALIYPNGEFWLEKAVSIKDEGSFYRIDGTHIFDKVSIKRIIEEYERVTIRMKDKDVVLEVEHKGILKGIEEIDMIKERFRQAAEYMNWFRPAWNQLSEDERYVLSVFYLDGEPGAAERVADHFGIERKSAYNRKYRAVDRLSILLYGKY